MYTKTSIVIGAGFGDEGKGNVVGAVCQTTENPIVVRFGGGHQVGHTVYKDKKNYHVFSNFGSGTMFGAPTYWSKYCTFDPPAIKKEYEALKKMGITPILYLDPLAMCTLPQDKAYNQQQESRYSHGSVGVGFGATIERNERHYCLNAIDLLNETVFNFKYLSIDGSYYMDENAPNEKDFLEAVKWIRECDHIHIERPCLRDYHQVIFEGHQGIMLDQYFGFFPHVTRSDTTRKNAIEIICDHDLYFNTPDIYYVTRAYQTRHGNGPVSNQGLGLKIKESGFETNKDNFFQGIFKRGVLDLGLLRHAINSDIYSTQHFFKTREILVVTCLDEIDGKMAYTDNKETHEVDISKGFWKKQLPVQLVYFSRSPVSGDLKDELRNY